MSKNLLAFLFVYLFSNYLFSQSVIPLKAIDSLNIKNYLAQAEAYKKQGDKKEQSDFIDKIAMIYWEHNAYQKAIEYYLQSLLLNQELDNQSGISMLNSNLGMIYADAHEYEKSLEYFTKTLIYRRTVKEKVGIISALINSSVVLNNLKRYDESVGKLTEALDLAREMNDITQMRSCYGMLSETYEKWGNPQKSMYYFEYYRTFNEKIVNEKVQLSTEQLLQEQLRSKLIESEKQNSELKLLVKESELQNAEKELIEVNSEYYSLIKNYSKKELQIELLKRETKINDLEAKSQKIKNEHDTIKFRFVITAFTLTLLLLIMVIYAYHIKHQDHRLLENQNKEIKMQQYEIMEKKQELEIANGDIKKQVVELKELNATKDKFFSILAHDLKNPFNVLLGFSKMLLRDLRKNDDEKNEKMLQSIFDASKMGYALLENLLQWARSQTGKISYKPYKLSLNSIIIENTTAQIPLTKEKNITLKSEPNNFIIMADADMVYTIFRNLISNAIKFTRNDGEIHVSARQSGDFAEIMIKDNGVGIEPDYVTKLFRIDTNHTTAGTKGERGTGLGLILCKEFVEKHCGKIWVESVVDVGTTFYFTLPLAKE